MHGLVNCFTASPAAAILFFVIPRIRELLHAAPFQPFTIRTSDGREYVIPTADHAAVNPKRTRVIVFSDNDCQVEVAGLHVAAVLRNGKVER